jgi:hypothetical protein
MDNVKNEIKYLKKLKKRGSKGIIKMSIIKRIRFSNLK